MSNPGANVAKEAIPVTPGTLSELAKRMPTPAYDRAAVQQSIVHIGVGGFFRAHQAVYLDDLLKTPGNEEWGIVGVGLLPHDAAMRDAMLAQDCLYSVTERSATGDSPRIIGSMVNFLFAPDNREAVLSKMADAKTRIVSLTITEGGYYVDHGTNKFDASHPDIVRDLAHPHEPQCSFGYLAEALDRRRKAGLPPFTIMSCDNLQGNGDIAREMILSFCELRDRELADWLRAGGAFPNSMVDRITPATNKEVCELVKDKLGIDDKWPVVCEPFRQWVIEDHFPLGRPAWEKAGAMMTQSVVPYEKMKLRMLNASHQALCYIGLLLGYDYVHESLGDPEVAQLVGRMMENEVIPLLGGLEGVDLQEYKRMVIERFSNPSIKDTLERIATDASARIPKFVLPSLHDQLASTKHIKMLTFVVASWFRYLSGTNDEGKAMPINDPLAAQLREHAKNGRTDPRGFLTMTQLFGNLGDSELFVTELTKTLKSFYDNGARATLRNALSA